MREIDFLPAWYSQTRRRLRMVFLHVWMSLILAVGLGLWMFLVHRNIRTAEMTLVNFHGQVSQTDGQLVEMKTLTASRDRWRQQDLILSKLGAHVEISRLIRTIDAAMPREMSLVGLQCDTDEKLEASGATGARFIASSDQTYNRKLRVRLQGVAPTDVDLANFMQQLSNIAFFEQVAIGYVKEASDSGHLVREFEVTFCMNLDIAAGS